MAPAGEDPRSPFLKSPTNAGWEEVSYLLDDEPYEIDNADNVEDFVSTQDQHRLMRLFVYQDVREEVIRQVRGEGVRQSTLQAYQTCNGRFSNNEGMDQPQAKEVIPFMYQTFRALKRFHKQNEFMEAMVIVVDDGTLADKDANPPFLPLPGGDGKALGFPEGAVQLSELLYTKKGKVRHISTGELKIKTANGEQPPAPWTFWWFFDTSRSVTYRPIEEEDEDGPEHIVPILNNIVAFSWSPLFSEKMSYQERFFMLHALIDAERDASVFTTVAGTCFEENSWYLVRTTFWASCCRDILSVFLLLWIGFRVRDGKQPDKMVEYTIVFLSVLACFGVVVEFLVTTCFFKGHPTLDKGFSWKAAAWEYLKGWTVLFILLEVVTASTMIMASSDTMHASYASYYGIDLADEMTNSSNNATLMKSCSIDVDPEQQCWYVRNPLALMSVVLGKCGFVIIKFLCYRPFGSQVFCAYATIISPESIAFGIFIMMMIVSSFFAYYMYPIQENMMESMHMNSTASLWGQLKTQHNTRYAGFHPILKTFMKVFRLALMGDFDLYELEGIDPVINAGENWLNASVPEGEPVAEIDDGDTTQAFHLGINVFFMFGVFMNLVLLNVYIGLLGNVYNDLYEYRHQIFAEFRATFCVKQLAWRALYEKFFQPDAGISGEVEGVVLAIKPRLGIPFSDLKEKKKDE